MGADPEIREPGAVIPPARLHHVVLKTRHLEAMKEFYNLLIGTEEVTSVSLGPVTATFTSYDEANHRLAFFGAPIWEGEITPRTVGLHHVAYEYDSLDDLVHTYRRLQGRGIESVWTTDHGPTISFYYNDPDGNLVELQVDNFPDEPGRSKQFMATDSRYNDPAHATGEDIDMAQLIAAHDSGMTHAEIHDKTWAGEFRPENPTGPPM